MKGKVISTVLALSALAVPALAANVSQAGYISNEYIVQPSAQPDKYAHSSSIVETPDGLLAAWFCGSAEGNPSCKIYLADYDRKTAKWTEPRVCVEAVYGDEHYACWNPVLYRLPDGRLALFYKIGNKPYWWWGYVKLSADNGKTWSKERELPSGIFGPIKNQPVTRDDGAVICPTSSESRTRSWVTYFQTLLNPADSNWKWDTTPPLNDSDFENNPAAIQAIQPAILQHPGGVLQALCRTKQGYISEVWSKDGGRSWSAMTLTGIRNPNSGIDAVTLKNGMQLLVYNDSPDKRTPLNVAVSRDGKRWYNVLVLEEVPGGDASYPYVIQTTDGLVHVTYSYKKKDSGVMAIKHAIIDPAKLTI